MKIHVIASVLMVVTLGLLVSCNSPPSKGSDFIGNYPPQKIEVMMLNVVNEKTNSLDPIEITFMFNPKKNVVDMNMHYALNIVTVSLAQDRRETMLAAMKKYITDYQAGNLTTNNAGSKAYFGQINVPVVWGLITTAYKANPKLRFEYHFVTPKKPYFMLNSDGQPPVDTYGNAIADSVTTSPNFRIGLTPIQCQHIIDMLNQDALVKIVTDLDAAQSQFDIPETSGTDKTNQMF